ncbi:hypothetical protein AB4371_21975 [Vibrio sp. 10N.261.51.A3]|uniref:hypothetical protein n=1 Tax=unclassified Vibrio TaxID=2614977 RepID=UPI000C85DF34|nr:MULTISPECIES: hypothetical protein [unclassified Vibrio]PML73462.1 hypothetical protein BCT71_07805 [Vibrio sp. 10N.261.51.A7]TKF70272.1 hypothetical protein FCV55_10525 [Vibrio sp. F13]
MEVSSSAVSSVMKVGLQIVTSRKRPVLEVYHQVHNRFGPEKESRTSWGENDESVYKTRYQEIFVQFTLVNIGAERAENVKLSISGDLKREFPREHYPNNFNEIYPQIAPGQLLYLFQFSDSDLLIWETKAGAKYSTKKMKQELLEITMEYDPPKGLINTLLSLPWSLRGKRRYCDKYLFKASMVEGDLPPAEYA